MDLAAELSTYIVFQERYNDVFVVLLRSGPIKWATRSVLDL